MSGSAGTFPPDGASTSLDDLVAAYLQQLDDGRDVDPARFVEPWPQHQVEFLEFAARHSGLDRMTTRPVTDAAQMPWRETSEERNGLEAEFQMGGLLGRGGMGTVWAATRRSDQQRVAIKILNASVATVDDNRIRFLREARAIQSLDHHHIVPCLDVGHASGSPYLVMKLIDGVTLSDVVAEQMRSGSNRSTVALADSNSKEPHSDANSRVSECLAQAQRSNTYFHTIAQLIADVAAAVKAAHEQAIVHRDIKPSNLMLDCIGTVWLTDFGLASIGDAQTLLSHTGDILGTPAFMSPEQASGNRDVVDHRTDIYALGATLYTLAALQRPYTGSSHKVLRDVSEGILTPPSKHRADIPRDVEAIILKAMARDPAKRYQSCASLETELRRFVEGHRVRARLPGPANRFVLR